MERLPGDEPAAPAGSPESDGSVEMVEVVDHAGDVVGLVTRAEMRARRLRHRSVFIAVFSHDGDLLVHRRSDTKDLWPGWWDLAIGGVVAEGESWQDAARRELAEEIGAAGTTIEDLGGGAYSDHDVSLVARCHRTVFDGPFTYADGEVTEAHWVARRDLPEWLAAKPFLPDSLALVLPRLGWWP
jgi:isopentenyldiphosphate isomerase